MDSPGPGGQTGYRWSNVVILSEFTLPSDVSPFVPLVFLPLLVPLPWPTVPVLTHFCTFLPPFSIVGETAIPTTR